ncbi:hypothetical protein ACWDQO_16725 [Streptomyces sp. NPDC003703]|uniref:hypothetical protein n=1 Tax=Streptomyces sp. NPDC003283 TaxID=3364681 RepID=UPI0036A00077
MTAFNDQDDDRLPHLAPHFTTTAGSLQELRSHFTAFVAVAERDGGLTLDGFAAKGPRFASARWEFTVDDDWVEKLKITPDVPVDSDRMHEVMEELRENIPARAAQAAFARVTDKEGRTHPKGTVRRLRLGEHLLVHRWEKGACGDIDWIVTSEKADADVFRFVRSPSSGDHDDRGGGARKYCSVSSHLELKLGWDGDGYQKATVSYWAKPYYWDAVKWYGEDRTLSEQYVPKVTGTLTLTGPDGTAVSTEPITVSGGQPPYERTFSREFDLGHLPPGTYTLTFGDAQKTGGSTAARGQDWVKLSDHSVAFTIGT